MLPRVPFFFLIPFLALFARGADPAQLDRDLSAANALVSAGKGAEAREAFARILAYAPANEDANYALALMAVNNGDWEKGLQFADKAVTANPKKARNHWVWGAANGLAALKGGTFSKLGYAKKCLAGYQRAVELEPQSAQYHFALLGYYQQAPGFVGGGMDKAYAEAAAIKKLDVNLGHQAYYQLYIQEKKFDDAFRECDEVMQKSPDDYATLYSFGRVTVMSGKRLDEGLKAFRHCLDLPPAKVPATEANVHWRIGSVLEQQGKTADARAAYETALAKDPKCGPARKALDKINATKT